MDDTSELIQQRVRKLEALRGEGVNPFPNHHRVGNTSKDIIDTYGSMPDEELKKVEKICSIAGRIVAVRDFGKASFVQVQDRKGRIQAYVRKDLIGESAFQLFKKLDIGDFILVEGKIFRTKTHELTLQVQALQLLVKSLRPLPEKWHGLTDVETRYRQRYLDLIANPRVKEIFLIRVQAIQIIRDFFNSREFLEVETPMMHPIPGGATAKPFNRNFRNEGISTQHNPEFTMLEFYQSYATYEDLMSMTEDLFCSMVKRFHGGLKLTYGGKEIDFTPPWRRIPLKDSLIEVGKLDPAILTDPKRAEEVAKGLGLELKKGTSHGRILGELFEEKVEPCLLPPTFITHYPTEISPLSRRNEQDPTVVDRFELFITGREIANGFSELNDPIDQKERFLQQIKEKFEEDDLFLRLDEDFIRALECGMPPTAGEGIGIDRWVMILADAPSIRDVILFPLLRMEK